MGLSVPAERIDQAIRLLRGHRVMLDSDLAALYAVSTKVLNQAVRRNRARFPADFMFQITPEEADSLRSQIVTLKVGRGKFRKYRPYVFTEQRVAMLSSVLTRIIHEHFCCNREFAATTSLRRAGSPFAPSTYCLSTPRGLTAPRARLATRLRDFATNRHE